ncbi:MAG: hypothetical protein CMF17_06580 [Idiomarinaceae bacterium]|nr:hypothetical protein [Idiomarinaceae bacterium]
MRLKLSVLMAVKNEEKYLSNALKSVLSFDHQDEFCIEVIVVDDGSSDNTYGIASSFTQDPRVKVFKNQSQGKVSAFNYAYCQSSGDYFIFLAGDDELVSEVLVDRVKVLQSVTKGKPSVSRCRIRTFSLNPRFDGVIYPKDEGKGSDSGGAICMNKDFANLVFPIPECLPNEDTWISLHSLYFDVSIRNISSIGLNYRIHEQNSHRRDVSFEVYNDILRRRELASLLFFNKYYNVLSSNKRSSLLTSISSEIDRAQGELVSLLFKRKLPFRRKVSLAFYCKSYLFSLRMYFNKLFSGL